MGFKGVVGFVGVFIVVLLVLFSVYIILEIYCGVMLWFGELVEIDIQVGIYFKVLVIDQVWEFDIWVLIMDFLFCQYLIVEKKLLDVDFYIVWKICNVDQFYWVIGGDEFCVQLLLLLWVDNGLWDEFGICIMYEVVFGQWDELMYILCDWVNEILVKEFGIEVFDVWVKVIEFLGQVSENVYCCMVIECEKLVQEFCFCGCELVEGICVDVDCQCMVILVEVFVEFEEIWGEGDGQVVVIYVDVYGLNVEFYSFYCSFQVYQNIFFSKDDIMVIDFDSDFMKFLKDLQGGC